MKELQGSVRKLQIVRSPHPALSTVAEPIEDPTDPRVAALAKRMIRLMQNANGLGLAANQVGVPVRMFVTHVVEGQGRTIRDRPATCHVGARLFINPAIVESSDLTFVREEGCLSLPGVTVDVRRSHTILFSYFNQHGKAMQMRCGGLLARCVQHEIDHLNGVEITSYLKNKAAPA